MRRLTALTLAVLMSVTLTSVNTFAEEEVCPVAEDTVTETEKAGEASTAEDNDTERSERDLSEAEVIIEEPRDEDGEGQPANKAEGAPLDDILEEAPLDDIPEEAPLNAAADIASASATGSKAVYRIDIVNSGSGYSEVGTIDGVDERKFKPTLTVKLGSATLKEGTDYEISSVYTFDPYYIRVTIRGIKKYTGTKQITLPSYLAWTYAGSNRYGTALEIIKTSHTNLNRIVVVSGIKFPDALAANAYAGLEGNPLVLVKPDSVPSKVKQFLTDIAGEVQEVVLIGGELKGAEKEMKEILKEASFRTIAGKNRYVTANEVTKAFIKEKYGTQENPDGPAVIDGAVFVATGQVAADALSAASWSYREGIPVILAKNGIVDSESKKTLARFSTVILLGSKETVSDKNVPAGAKKIRLGGKNRWETSRLIADHFVNTLGLTKVSAIYAPGGGSDFVDALAAGQLSVYRDAAVVLVDKNHAVAYQKTMRGEDRYGGHYFVGSAGYNINGGAIFNSINKSIVKEIKAQLSTWGQ